MRIIVQDINLDDFTIPSWYYKITPAKPFYDKEKGCCYYNLAMPWYAIWHLKLRCFLKILRNVRLQF